MSQRSQSRLFGWNAVFALACVFAASSGGCSESPSPSTVAPAPPAAEDEEEASSDAEPVCAAELAGDCGACMKASCCDALTECEGDPDCAACVRAEDSDACERTEATHQRVDAFLTCKGGACASSCIKTGGGSCEGVLDDMEAKDCAACLEKSCCDEVAACHGDDGTGVCWDGCFTNHDETKCHGDPDGHALFHAMGACATKKCKKECGA